jgi:hypothetical protein
MLVLQLEPLYLIYILLCSHFILTQAALEPPDPAAIQAPANEDDLKYFHEPFNASFQTTRERTVYGAWSDLI